MKRKMIEPTKNELREEIGRLNHRIIELYNEIERLEQATIPRWAYNFQGR